MRRVARREADEVRRVLARRVRSGARRDNLELLDEQRESRRAALSTFQKRPQPPDTQLLQREAARLLGLEK